MVTILPQFLSFFLTHTHTHHIHHTHTSFSIFLFWFSLLPGPKWVIINICTLLSSSQSTLLTVSPYALHPPLSPWKRQLSSSLLLWALARTSLLAPTTLYWSYLWKGQFSQLTVGSLRERLLFYSLMNPNPKHLAKYMFSKCWIIKNMLRTYHESLLCHRQTH